MIVSLSEIMTENPFYIGSLCLILGVSSLIYKISKKNSFKMKDYNVMSWKAMVNSWAFIIMLIVLGITLIFQN
ncbi:hypothetical protein Aeqsu_1717 [Aequorivita sublithincola DSM 14238]|uniref:Uncharacterized protein n=1 Tax=Aequorivita sublithincola (strain DSM 14238 / LMG 21431 / ACAM 643 / 9-3) TaxID=746697 RepID=I3YW29_AEQSU|nr:hypothetical protein Aeqsu_1717 [Aequorivita sublithincola DSM 14238]